MAAKSKKVTQEQFTSLGVRVATDLADFGELWPRTGRHAGVYCYPFQCADVLQVWCDTVGKARNTSALFVAVFDRDESPMLLLPLGIERRKGIKILRFLDGGVSDYNAPVLFEPIREWQRDTVKILWRNIVRALPRFDIALLDKMPADVEGAPNPLINLECSPCDQSAHFTFLTGTWDEYAAERLPRRSNLLYKRRKLRKLGKLTFRVAETQADRHAILRDVLRQKSAHLIKTTGVDGFDRPGYSDYFWLMTDRFTWPGPLLVAALELDGKVLSGGWHFVSGGRFVFFLTSFEGEEWRYFSPGRLLIENLIEWSFSNAISVFDFTIGDEAYKFEYADQKLSLFKARIPVSVLGKAHDGIRRSFAERSTQRIVKRLVDRIRKTI